MASSPVKILSVTHVTAAATAVLREPMIRFSAMDALWLTLPLIQRVLIFVDGDGGGIPPFSSLLDGLRSSLASTLARFLPLAGRLVLLPPFGEDIVDDVAVAVDCSAGGVSGGVRFVAAEWLGADARRLAGNADHDAEAFSMLAPALHAGELPAEALAVQTTRLDGGVALGVAMHHAVADGRSVWSFLRAWEAECRGEAPEEPPPAFDRAALRLPGGDDLGRTVLRKYAPNLPLVADMPNYLVKARKHGVELSRRTLAVSSRDIRRLKQRIEEMDARRPRRRLTQAPSSFVALAALAWTTHIRCKRGDISPNDDVHLFFFADCRGRLNPPVEERYFGTCVVGCLASVAARDILAVDGVAAAAAAAQAEVLRAAGDPLARWDWMATAAALPLERTRFPAYEARFPAYEATDFGWGSPARTELATMRRDGQVVLVGGRGGDGGGVQASVAQHAARIDAFESHFRSWLQE